MPPGSRALAFATRWFDPATAHHTFEPLVADWQGEWRDAPEAARAGVSVRGWWAFVQAVLVSIPRIAMTAAPADVTNEMARGIARFVAVATVVLMIPPVLEIGRWWMRDASWVRGSLILFALPSALSLAFPFAMTGAVDALRKRDPLPAHVERAAMLKLGALSVIMMLVCTGWIIPAASQAGRIAMNPAGMDAPFRGMRELTTYELVVDPARATVFAPGTALASRSTSIRRELNQRAAFVAMPVIMLWLRWRALNQPRRRWVAPLPAVAAAAIGIAAMFASSYTGARLERDWQLWAGSGYWVPVAVFILWGWMTRYVRPLLLARTNPKAPSAPRHLRHLFLKRPCGQGRP